MLYFYFELCGKTSLVFAQKPKRGDGMSPGDTQAEQAAMVRF